MRYVASYSVRFGSRPPDLADPIVLAIGDVEFSLHTVDIEGKIASANMSMGVDPGTLEARPDSGVFRSEVAVPSVYIPEADVVSQARRSVLRLLTFILGMDIDMSASPNGARLIPETPDDERHLQDLGSRLPHQKQDLVLELSMHGPRINELDDATLERLLGREVGLALYADALRLRAPIGQFREYWRVLESAFRERGARLSKLLAGFEPVGKLGFDEAEIEQLRVLRGRASHAESRGGLDEYNTVSVEVANSVGRLKSLAECVLLSKKTWGSESGAWEWMAPLAGYVDRSGTLVIVQTEGQSSGGKKGKT